MENKIKRTLKKWESSLINYGKIDQWRIDEDYSILGYFIASKKSNVAKNAFVIVVTLPYSGTPIQFS